MRDDERVRSHVPLLRYNNPDFYDDLDADSVFGYGAKNAGDVNGDGVYDIIASAVVWDSRFTGRNQVGIVWILFISRTGDILSYLPIEDNPFQFTALEEYDWFGLSVGSIGDLNGISLIYII